MSTIKEQKNKQIQVKNNDINKILNKKENDILNEKANEKEKRNEEGIKILKNKDDAERKCIDEEITEKQKVLKIKFDEMIHKEILNDIKGRLRLLHLEIIRLLEILEKIDPLL
ncbi:257_t:CDS:1, partial [Racocetra fulgida]